MTQDNQQAGQSRDNPAEDEISLVDLLLVLARHRRWVIGAPMVFGVIALLVVLIMPPLFTSKVIIMPPQQQSGGALAMLGDVAGLAGLAGGAVKSQSDMYVAMLESRPIQDALIKRFDLLKRYDKDYWFQARKKLDRFTDVSADKKSGLITIEVDDYDPEVAVKMATAYVEELQKLSDGLAISEASRRRLFFEKQLKQAKDNLANAEVALRSTQEKTKMVLPEGQVPAIFGMIAQLRATIAAKEVQINAMKSFATAQNPDLKLAQQELAALNRELDKLQRDHPTEAGDFVVPSSRLPATGLDYVRARRDVKYYETMFEILAKQFELAKIDEAKEATLIQVVEPAVPAELRSKPMRALITLLATLGGLMFGILAAFVRESWHKIAADPEFSGRLAELRGLAKRRTA